MLQVQNVRFHYKPGKPVLEDISFSLERGEVLCLLGPNGTGKTTLLRCLLGLSKATGGSFFWDGEDLGSLPVRQRARIMAYVPQSSALTFPYEVREVVLMGRVAHLRAGGAPGSEDRQLAQKAMERMNIASLATNMFAQLSGGEKQLVLMARALAQQAQLLVLDEPTANLDFANQVRALQMIRDLSHQGFTVLMASHSPDHALLTANQVVLMRDGTVYKCGHPEDTITEESLSNLYKTHAMVFNTAVKSAGRNVKVCIPVIEE